jgi:hypothetical protein
MSMTLNAKLRPDDPWPHDNEPVRPNGKDERHEYLRAKFEELPALIRLGFRDVQPCQRQFESDPLWR